MGHKVFPQSKKFLPRKGLEGPFDYPNGRTLYYDPKEGEYYDPTTDFYVPRDEIADLHRMVLGVIAK